MFSVPVDRMVSAMFDFDSSASFCATSYVDQIDPEKLTFLLSGLSDRELAQLEDDLNFFHFSGIASELLRVLIEEASVEPELLAA